MSTPEEVLNQEEPQEKQEVQEEVQKFKVGENEYTSEEISTLVEKANRYDPLEKDYTRKSQRLAQFEKESPMLENAKKLFGLAEENADFGNALRVLVGKAMAGEPMTLAEKKELVEAEEEMTPFQKNLLKRVEDQDRKINEFQNMRKEEQSKVEQEQILNAVKEKYDVFKNDPYAEVVLLSMLERDPNANPMDLADTLHKKRAEEKQVIIDEYINSKKTNANTNPLKAGMGGKQYKKPVTEEDIDKLMDELAPSFFNK